MGGGSPKKFHTVRADEALWSGLSALVIIRSLALVFAQINSRISLQKHKIQVKQGTQLGSWHQHMHEAKQRKRQLPPTTASPSFVPLLPADYA